MPNKRASGRRVRGFSLPDDVFLPARRLADALGDDLSAVVRRALLGYSRRAEKRLEEQRREQAEAEREHGDG